MRKKAIKQVEKETITEEIKQPIQNKEELIPIEIKRIYCYAVSFEYTNEDGKREYGNNFVELEGAILTYRDYESLQTFLNDNIVALKGLQKNQFALMGCIFLPGGRE
jgi:hypothetical protein